MAQYFTVKAVFEVEDAKGKIKKQTETYLVDAMSVTEAEARITDYLSASPITGSTEPIIATMSDTIEPSDINLSP